MKQNNLSTTFTAIVNGADVNTNLDLQVPELDLTFLLIKDNTATLYIRTKKEIDRYKFYKKGKYRTKIESLGFTVGEVKTGTQANSAIRAILGTEGWVCNDPDALSMFEGEVQEREEVVRIDWKKQKHGRLDVPCTVGDIARDFSDRLTVGDVNDLEDYIMYLSNIDPVLFVHVAPHTQLLKTLETNYC